MLQVCGENEVIFDIVGRRWGVTWWRVLGLGSGVRWVKMNRANLMNEYRTATDKCSTSKDHKFGISMKCVPIRIEYLNSQFLVFDADMSEQLMKECRIITEACGTSPEARADLRKYGAPFVLMPEQVAVLVEYGCTTQE
ncbi:putative tRNA-splicing endonuclease subunit [Dirofilaria immitis]